MVSFTFTSIKYSANGSWMLVKSFQALTALYASTHPHGTYTGIDFETPLKADEPKVVGGIVASHVIEVSDLQPWKAKYRMLVTLSPIATEVKEEQL
jgi:hypothetical protein